MLVAPLKKKKTTKNWYSVSTSYSSSTSHKNHQIQIKSGTKKSPAQPVAPLPCLRCKFCLLWHAWTCQNEDSNPGNWLSLVFYILRDSRPNSLITHGKKNSSPGIPPHSKIPNETSLSSSKALENKVLLPVEPAQTEAALKLSPGVTY